MYRGTTPTLPIRIPGHNLTEAKLFLTFQDGRENRTMTMTTPEDFTVTYDAENQATVGNVTLTQEQTLMLNAGSCTAQIRFVFPDGSAGATVKRTITVSDVILKGVIEYE